MARSLNRAQIIGNLTRDPELRYTPNGTAVCSFSVATNRNWTTDSGEKREEVEFHRVVAWNKLAEICSQFLVKGRKVFLEGRLSTRSWNAQDGTQKSTTEIIITDMLLLDSKRTEEEKVDEGEPDQGIKESNLPAGKAGSQSKEEPESQNLKPAKEAKAKNPSSVKASTADKSMADESDGKKGKKSFDGTQDKKEQQASEEEISPDDIPF